MLKFCPKCNAQVYDDTSFFCYKCGMQLPVHIREKEKDRSQTHERQPDRESTYVQADALASPEPVLIQPVKPESPDDSLPSAKPASIYPAKSRSTHVRNDSQVLPKASAIHPANPVEICALCGSSITDENRIYCKNCGAYIHQGMPSAVSSIVKDEPALIKEISIPSNPKVNDWKLIVKFIVKCAGFVIILFFIFFILYLLASSGYSNL
jgi:hypothetical protein